MRNVKFDQNNPFLTGAWDVRKELEFFRIGIYYFGHYYGNKLTKKEC